ncbi:MAG: hypothetical protein QQN63_09575 [Nitrosopumilus sp.]
MKELQQMVKDWVEDRPTLKENNTLEQVFFLLSQEMDEVEGVLHDRELIKSELPDLLFFLLTLANIHGIDLETEFREKVSLNILKYIHQLFADDSGFNYYEAKQIVKENEGEVKKEFYGT